MGKPIFDRTMSRTYQATGINVKGMPLGESDRLVTILTPEYGLIRAIAPGARKYKSKLRGRSELFVVNQLAIAKGRSLDKITQAETIQTYPGLSRDLGKLAASQYLAELVLCFESSDRPSVELYELFKEHLRRIEKLPAKPSSAISMPIMAHLTQGVFHLLALAGIAPSVHLCCATQRSVIANFDDPNFKVGFSFEAGGAIALPLTATNSPKIDRYLTALELNLLQKLGEKFLPTQELINLSLESAWVKLERLLRDYAQYYFDRTIKSASLIDISSIEF